MTLTKQIMEVLWSRYQAGHPSIDVEIWQDCPWTACRVRVLWDGTTRVAMGHAWYDATTERTPFSPERGCDIAVRRALKRIASEIVAQAEAKRPKMPDTLRMMHVLCAIQPCVYGDNRYLVDGVLRDYAKAVAYNPIGDALKGGVE